jgi:transposase
LQVERQIFNLHNYAWGKDRNRYQGIDIDISKIYRFLDKLHNRYQPKVEQISFNHTQRVLGHRINVIFYDMTTLYFEASDEDDLRVTGFSKDGKHQNPQIFLGLLVGKNGYPIGYNIFEGNIYEGHTLIPILKQFQEKFKIGKPIVIADSGILSNKNLGKLQKNGYQYILGARIKNETASLKTSITGHKFKDGKNIVYKRQDENRLIVNYSLKRAKKDAANRKRGLERLEKKVISGKLTKKNINNRGYNKYLKLDGEIKVTIDYERYEQDEKWDGLKGYITNTKLRAKNVIENYNELWQIEKAFKISKTDLRIRPIYHRIRNRIESHICICFTAYSLYKELERILKITNAGISPERAIELTKTIYMLEIVLPQSEKVESMIIDIDNEQEKLLEKLKLGLRVSQ